MQPWHGRVLPAQRWDLPPKLPAEQSHADFAGRTLAVPDENGQGYVELNIAPARTYRVAMNEFLAGGCDGFAALGQGANKLVGAFDLDLSNSYLAAHSTAAAPLTPPATERITIIQ